MDRKIYLNINTHRLRLTVTVHLEIYQIHQTAEGASEAVSAFTRRPKGTGDARHWIERGFQGAHRP